MTAKLKTEGELQTPFSPSTKINYKMKNQQMVEIELFDLNGNVVDTLFKGICNIGENVIYPKFNNAKSGTYFYRIKSNDTTFTKRIVLVK